MYVPVPCIDLMPVGPVTTRAVYILRRPRNIRCKITFYMIRRRRRRRRRCGRRADRSGSRLKMTNEKSFHANNQRMSGERRQSLIIAHATEAVKIMEEVVDNAADGAVSDHDDESEEMVHPRREEGGHHEDPDDDDSGGRGSPLQHDSSQQPEGYRRRELRHHSHTPDDCGFISEPSESTMEPLHHPHSSSGNHRHSSSRATTPSSKRRHYHGSPGTTSLSSVEPSQEQPRQRVLLQFVMPETQYRSTTTATAAERSQSPAANRNNAISFPFSHHNIPPAPSSPSPPMIMSGLSSSLQSYQQQQQQQNQQPPPLVLHARNHHHPHHHPHLDPRSSSYQQPPSFLPPSPQNHQTLSSADSMTLSDDDDPDHYHHDPNTNYGPIARSAPQQQHLLLLQSRPRPANFRQSSVRSLRSVKEDRQMVHVDDDDEDAASTGSSDNELRAKSHHNHIQHNRLAAVVVGSNSFDRHDNDNDEPDFRSSSLQNMERLYEDPKFRGSGQHVLRPHYQQHQHLHLHHTTTNTAAAVVTTLNKKAFLRDQELSSDVPTYICPRCGSIQREFFTTANVAGRLEGPAGYLALFFSIYVMCSLFIFGLEEGWMPLDCIYFAVLTLTTTGLYVSFVLFCCCCYTSRFCHRDLCLIHSCRHYCLVSLVYLHRGDFVPTSNANKLICSIFIYFGVACIGLLLGSYIASMLDSKAAADRLRQRKEACSNCARLRALAAAAVANNKRRRRWNQQQQQRTQQPPPPTQPLQHVRTSSDRSSATSSSHNFHHHHHRGATNQPLPQPVETTPHFTSRMVLGSPGTRHMLGRQKHTRHQSFDVTRQRSFGAPSTIPAPPWSSAAERQRNNNNSDTPTDCENDDDPTVSSNDEDEGETSTMFDNASTTSSSYSTSGDDNDDGDPSSINMWDKNKAKFQAAQYVFLTLRTALANSLVIIAVGCVGFHIIEGFTIVDSWYFTTVLLTTVG
jgi:hypothetical protein